MLLTGTEAEFQRTAAQPGRYGGGSQLVFGMEAQRVTQPSADVAGIEVVALDTGCLCDVGDGGDAVARVDEISAGFLSDTVLRERALALPVADDLRPGREATSGSGFRIGPVRSQVHICRDTSQELCHGFVVAGAVV